MRRWPTLLTFVSTAITTQKILLPKFNTWKQVHLERKKGSLPPLGNTVSRFSAINFCRYGVIASRLHCNGNAIAP